MYNSYALFKRPFFVIGSEYNFVLMCTERLYSK